VMQHFLFGSLLPYGGPAAPESENGGTAHSHGPGHMHEGWGDCCGIPVPSVFAAAESERKGGARIAGEGIRRVPFD